MSSELVAIELRLKGYEGVMSDMRMLDTMLNNLRGRKNRIEIQNNLAKAKKDVIAYKAELERLDRLQKNIQRGMKSGTLKNPAWAKRLAETSSKIADVTRKLKESRQAVTEFQYALKNLTPPSFFQIFNRISSVVGHAGSAMQSFGNALTRLTSPFRRFTTGLILNAGYKALNMVTEGFGGAFERYDTMQNYSKSLKALGLDADQTFKVFSKQKEAMTAIDNLNEAVLGLPTGLDEIVAAQKVYAGATGEMVKSTKTAIAANNTFLASGTEAREQRFLQKYLVSLASGAELTTNQWQSMARIAPLAMRAVSEELKYGEDEYQKFTKDVQNGTISGQQFLDAFIKVGTEGKVQAAANVMKTTWEGLSANIQNATKRMGEGVLKALDEAFVSYNGRNLVQNLLGFDAEGNEIGGGIKHFINDISEGLQKWVKAHPQEIMDFFNSLKSVNWRSLLKGIGDGFLELARLTEKVTNFLEGKDLSKIGKFMVMGNLWGKALTISGGLIKGTRHIWGLLGAGAVISFLKARGFTKYGLMGMLGRIVGGTAEGAAETATVASTTAKNIPKVGKMASGLSSIFKGWGQIATMVGGTALVGWGSMKLFKNTVKTFGETIELVKGIDWTTGASVLKKMGVFFSALLGASAIAGHFASASGTVLAGEVAIGFFTTLALGFADLDMHLLKRSLKALADATSYFDPIAKNIKSFKGFAFDKDTKSNIRNAVKELNGITDIVTGEFDTESHQRKGGLKNFSKKHAETLQNIKKSAQLLNQIASIEIDNEKLSTSTEGITDALNSIDAMITNIPSGLGDKGTVGTTGNLASVVGNLKTAFSSLIGKGGILSQIPKIVEKVKEMTADPENNMLTEFKIKMTQLGETFEEAYKGLAGKLTGTGDLMQRVTNFADAVYQARRIIYHLGKLNAESASVDVNGGVGVIETTISNLKAAFSSKKVGELKQQIETFVTSIKDALKTITEIGTEPIEIDASVKLSDGFYKSVEQVKKTIKDKKKEIKKLQSGITFSIPVHVTFSVSTNLGAALAKITADKAQIRASGGDGRGGGHNNKEGGGSRYVGATGGMFSRNGVLYRSGGGSVFKPRGVDKIPAMLAQGEYVHNKQAVDFFGVDFMRKINNMDVRGAMESLLTRAGTSVGIGRQSVVNNTVNNNQRITQNISTNNPNFAKARMGRFVGAL